MAEKRTTPETPNEDGRRRRAAPTIDLKAAEGPAGPDAAEQQAAGARREAKSRQRREAAAESSQPPPEAPAATTEQPPPGSEADGLPPSAPPRRGGFGAGLIGGAIVVVAVAVTAGALWYGGFIHVPASADNTGALRDQVAALQQQIIELQNRPAPAAFDAGAFDKTVASLGERVDRMEQSIASLPPGDPSVAGRVDAADSALKSLNIALAALSRRSDDIAAKATRAQEQAATAEKAVAELRGSVQSASRQASSAPEAGELEAVQQRIASLEQSVKSLRADLDQSTNALSGQVARAAAADRATRLALSASALLTAVESGAPYVAELARTKSLGADAQALAPLEQFAGSGIPGKSALAQQLRDIIPAIREAAGAGEPRGDFLDRLQANASKLVRIRPVEAPAGDAPADVLARIEAAAARDDIAGALADIGKLPEAARERAADWMARAAARQKALAAARDLAAETARRLGNG